MYDLKIYKNVVHVKCISIDTAKIALCEFFHNFYWTNKKKRLKLVLEKKNEQFLDDKNLHS